MAIGDPGTFLGRTPGSWAKITAFYVVYYTFLGLLIYGSVTYYADNLEQPGGKPPKIITRTNGLGPGVTVYPFQNIDASIDKENWLPIKTDKQGQVLTEDPATKAYIQGLRDFLVTIEDEDVKDCSKSTFNAESNTCAIKGFNSLVMKGEAENQGPDVKDNAHIYMANLRKKTPYVLIALNKVYDWSPVNRGGYIPGAFTKNSVQVKCFQAQNDGTKVTDNTLEVNVVSAFGPNSTPIDNALMPEFFPYKSKDKFPVGSNERRPYNKPFVVAQIKPTAGKSIAEAWEMAAGEEMKYFRCELFADNIQRPVTGEAFYKNPENQGWSNDLTKTGAGFVQFGFSFTEK